MSVFESEALYTSEGLNSSEAEGPSEHEWSWRAGVGEQLDEVAGAAWGGEGAPVLESPFGHASLTETSAARSSAPAPDGVESPFRFGFVPASEAERESEAFAQALAELEDEQFDEAVAQLVDEAAGYHLASGAAWSSSEAAPALATAELESWVQPLQYEADRMLENMADRLDGEDLATLREPELEALFESLRPDPGFLPEAFENFLGGVFNVAKKMVKMAAKGVASVAKLASLPIRFLLDKLKALVRPLLQKVLQKAVGLLPPSVQPLARTLATRLVGQSEGEVSVGDHDLARQFQVQAAALLSTPTEAEADALVTEAEAEAAEPGIPAFEEVDNARAQLAEQLAALPPGQEPVAELEQFIPVIMAAQQVIRPILGIIGRDKVVRFLARAIAGLIKGMVGADAANALGQPIASAGLKLLGLEAPPMGERVLGGEALASTVEETVRDVLQLPAEALEDTLRLEAEVQEAFAEAAARNIPSEHLRPDLPQLETAGEAGVWVLMPRAARPRYRYKKYSRVFSVPITRQVAQAIGTRDGGTLETYLSDRGANAWPAHVDVHLYEALPGTHLGHIAEFEGESDVALAETLDELQPLTPEAAAMLLHEPRLGRPVIGHPHARVLPHPHQSMGHRVPPPGTRRPAPRVLRHPHEPVLQHPATASHAAHITGGAHLGAAGQAAVHAGCPCRPLPAGNRYFRLRVPGQPRPGISHPRHRFRIRIEHLNGVPTVHGHLHLGERESQELGNLLHQGSLPSTLAWLKHRYQEIAPAVFTARLVTRGTVLLGSQPSHELVSRLAGRFTEALTQALSAYVPAHQAGIVAAVQNPVEGLTFAFTFQLTDSAALAAGRVPTPQISVHAGYHTGPYPPSPDPTALHPTGRHTGAGQHSASPHLRPSEPHLGGPFPGVQPPPLSHHPHSAAPGHQRG